MEKTPRKSTYRDAIKDFRRGNRHRAASRQSRIDLGKRLQFLREERGLYRHEVAAKLRPRVWPQTLHKWEIGEVSVSLDRVTELAKLYGVKVKDIFGELRKSSEGERGPESSEQAQVDRGEDRKA